LFVDRIRMEDKGSEPISPCIGVETGRVTISDEAELGKDDNAERSSEDASALHDSDVQVPGSLLKRRLWVLFSAAGSFFAQGGELSANVISKASSLLAADLSGLSLADDPEAEPPVLDSFDLAGIARHINSGRASKVVVLCGAGISVSAGIPDFRSPGTGLYENLQKYDLPRPEAVFDIDFFRENPRPFYDLAKELFPGRFRPTPTHFFIRMLHEKGLLLRCYTQNVDSLETQAGLPAEMLVAAHGNFDSSSCIKCGAAYSQDFTREAVMSGTPAKCRLCRSLVKPNIVFFGESLPERFFTLCSSDLAEADLLIVMGSSLQVQPFASLVDMVGRRTPRLLINRERVGEGFSMSFFSPPQANGFNFGEGNYRDALCLGNCDDGVRELSQLLGWEHDLDALIQGGTHREEEVTKKCD